MAKTFKDIQDQVLEWMADQNDTGLMLTLVKQSIDGVQRKILTDEQLDFMLSPVTTLNVTVGRQVYDLPEDFLSMLYVYDANQREYLEEVPPKGILEAEDGMSDVGNVLRYRVVQVTGVKRQPTTAGVVVVTPSGGNEAAANGVVIQGVDANGEWAEEALSSGSTWASLTSTTSFSKVTNIIKTGSSWTRTITVTSGSVTLLTLTASQKVKQYTQIELVENPTTTYTFSYRYFQKPIDLVYDYQLPQVPDAYRDILKYGALLMLPGFTKSDTNELAIWQTEYQQLLKGLKQNYQQARSLGARARRVRYITRI